MDHVEGPAQANRMARFVRIRKERLRQDGKEPVQFVRGEIGEDVDVVREAGLAECRAGPRTTDGVANFGRFERGAQGGKSIRGGHHDLR